MPALPAETIHAEHLTGEEFPSHKVAQSKWCVRSWLMLLVIFGRRLRQGAAPTAAKQANADAKLKPAFDMIVAALVANKR